MQPTMPFVGGALEEPPQDCVTKTEIADIIWGRGGASEKTARGEKGVDGAFMAPHTAQQSAPLCVSLSLPP